MTVKSARVFLRCVDTAIINFSLFITELYETSLVKTKQRAVSPEQRKRKDLAAMMEARFRVLKLVKELGFTSGSEGGENETGERVFHSRAVGRPSQLEEWPGCT